MIINIFKICCVGFAMLLAARAGHILRSHTKDGKIGASEARQVRKNLIAAFVLCCAVVLTHLTQMAV